MTVRTVAEAEAGSWWRLRLEGLEQEPFAFGKSAEEFRATSIQEVARLIREVPKESFYLGAFEGERLIGIVSFVRETGLKEKHKGHVYGFYVSAERRRKGVGRELLKTLIAEAQKDPSLEQILLCVATCQTAARALYRDLGFTVFGTEPNSLKVNGRSIDEDHMVLRIR
jgi:ribosomal protein S18 acetylase RimI-like enzyme